MNISPSLIYWITRLDSIHATFCVFTVVCSVILFVLFLFMHMEYDYRSGVYNTLKKFATRVFIVLCISIIGVIFTPNTKEMCTIIVIPKIANNEQLQDVGNEFIVLAKEWLKELRPENLEK